MDDGTQWRTGTQKQNWISSFRFCFLTLRRNKFVSGTVVFAFPLLRLRPSVRPSFSPWSSVRSSIRMEAGICGNERFRGKGQSPQGQRGLPRAPALEANVKLWKASLGISDIGKQFGALESQFSALETNFGALEGNLEFGKAIFRFGKLIFRLWKAILSNFGRFKAIFCFGKPILCFGRQFWATFAATNALEETAGAPYSKSCLGRQLRWRTLNPKF